MTLRNAFRRMRVDLKRIVGIEPRVDVREKIPLEYHGSSNCFWAIPKKYLTANPLVVDVGLGEDVSFSESILDAYGGKVYGFDPTPKSIDFVEKKRIKNFKLCEMGLSKTAGFTEFFLPLNENHVSGSLYNVEHVGGKALQVELVSIREVFEITGTDWIDILKLDIEGAEFEVIMDEGFGKFAHQIGVICIEFHHRWTIYGKAATERAVARLERLGFVCCWRNVESNEEFTFIRSELVPGNHLAQNVAGI